MTISFYAEDIELPAIKKEAVSNWIRKVAETYGKRQGISVTSSVPTKRFWK